MNNTKGILYPWRNVPAWAFGVFGFALCFYILQDIETFHTIMQYTHLVKDHNTETYKLFKEIVSTHVFSISNKYVLLLVGVLVAYDD
jgi:hypothetical protein